MKNIIITLMVLVSPTMVAPTSNSNVPINIPTKKKERD